MQRLSLSFFALLAAFVAGSPCLAQSHWEVAVMFLGAKESPEYQVDIDRNLMELARLRPGSGLRLSLYREFDDRAVEFFPDSKSTELHSLGSLLSNFPQKVEVSGRMNTWPREPNDPSGIMQEERLKSFFSISFSEKKAKRLLIIYGHGLGFEGLQVSPLKEFRGQLEKGLPARKGKPLDLLWLDACFMATAEVATELKGVAPRFMASQESEFSAGAPFDALQDILGPGPDNVDDVAKALAERFLESYSFLEEGSQTSAVYKSSATVSVVDTERLAALLPSVKILGGELGKLPEGWKQATAKRLIKYQMEKADLVDFGSFLLDLKSHKVVSSSADSPLKLLITSLELGKKNKIKSNPRLLARPPHNESLLVYGYEKWERGDEKDTDLLEILPPNLKPAGFIDGPNKKRWPQRQVKVRLYLTPFTVGLGTFNFFFADPATLRPITKNKTYVRHSDYVIFPSEEEANPLRVTGYTQGIGKTAEKYTGLAVAMPTQGVPDLDYLNLDFYDATGWAGF